MAAKTKQIFSDKFIKDLAEISEGFLSADQFEKLAVLFEAEIRKHYWTESSEANLQRILFSLYDRVSFLIDCLKYPHHPEIVITIAANSNYLTDIVVRNPEFLYQVFNPTYLNSRLAETEMFNEVNTGMNNFKSLRSKINFLKNYKRRTILKIGLNDFQGTNDLQTITLNLSILAKVINAALFKICCNEIQVKHGTVFSDDKYSLCSLGKLGGSELNYSSDVDLILFFDQNTKFGKNDEKEYFEILSETALLFIKHSTEITDKGFVYRVDFRLRPDGRNSPICMSLADYLRYYETRGEDWERQMLIKLNFIGGSEDLFVKFKNYLSSYIFPASFSIPPTVQIKRMKANIEKRLTGDDNIKLIPGGIRDIEFSIQALQLMNGGKYTKLKTGNSLEAIKRLAEVNLLNKNEAEIYNRAYVFYRKIEHYLQLMNDRQTHVIPTEGEILKKLTVYLGFKNVHAFNKTLTETKTEVRNVFNSVMTGEDEENIISADLFEMINFIDKNKAVKNLAYLRKGTGLLRQKEFETKTIRLFSEFENELADFLRKSSNPDKVLDNLVKIISSVQFVSIWYSEFNNSPFFKLVLSICEFSQRSVDLLSTNKSIGELLITRKVFEKNINFVNFSTEQILFILSVQLAVKVISHEVFSETLTGYLYAKLKRLNTNTKLPFKYFVAGLGSFGSSEMHYSSDIDLIVAAENITKHRNIQNIFQKYLSEAKELLSPFTVDFRLRPEGKSSPLVWDIDAYNAYLKSRARVWEFQSLIKLNFAEGNQELFDRFKSDIEVTLISDENKIKPELIGISKKIQQQGFINIKGDFNIKKNRGGILSIDFIVHTILMSNKNWYSDNLGKKVIEKINYLILCDKKFDDLKELIDIYHFYKTLELGVQNIFGTNLSSVPTENTKRKTLAVWMDEENIDQKIIQYRKTVNLIFEKYLGK